MAEISLSEFTDRLTEIMPVLMKEFMRRHADELFKTNITPAQFLILNFLHHSDESRMTELAKFMKVSTAAMTGIVNRLVRDGYVVRNYQPDDRRVINIKLTKKGNNLINKANQQRRDMVINVFGKVSDEDRQDYLRVLTRIYEILTKEQKEE
ncbi:MAG: MarR family transcriptional regulator [Candidatus Omnitrophica bacterium]|nr:MarR family transcriptional regulator [Candidatus Omnitrophota bacterium]MDD5352267.1 MarR family transcriptional regulator [Candidatus Omnitrophota bacterium]MDD5549865.1 MarR family transcriptional regulator [Candidatus Omnitrophota bacterium]